MPLYEYQCEACGHRLECLEKVHDEPRRQCPACHTDQLKRLVSATHFQLKGKGWYVTDFRDQSSDQPKTPDTPKKDSQTPTTEKKPPESGNSTGKKNDD